MSNLNHRCHFIRRLDEDHGIRERSLDVTIVFVGLEVGSLPEHVFRADDPSQLVKQPVGQHFLSLTSYHTSRVFPLW
jgi:hypothetical protein